MPTIRVEIGEVCAGGGHVNVHVFEDENLVRIEGREIPKLLDDSQERPGAITTLDEAVDRILGESVAADIETVKTRAENLEVVIGETSPRERPPRIEGGASGSR